MRIYDNIKVLVTCLFIRILVQHLLLLHNIRLRAEFNGNGKFEIVSYKVIAVEEDDSFKKYFSSLVKRISHVQIVQKT